MAIMSRNLFVIAGKLNESFLGAFNLLYCMLCMEYKCTFLTTIKHKCNVSKYRCSGDLTLVRMLSTTFK